MPLCSHLWLIRLPRLSHSSRAALRSILPVPAGWEAAPGGTAKAGFCSRGQRVNPGSCSPTQGGSSPLSCSSRPESSGPPGLNSARPGGHACPQRLGGLCFFGEISKILQKPGCGPSPGPSCLSLPIIRLKSSHFSPAQEGTGGCGPRGGTGQRMGKNPVPSPRPCGSLLPGVTARCPPNRVGPELGPAAFSPWISSLGKRLAGAAGFVHPWLGVCSGLGGPQNVLRRPCPPVTPRGQLPWGKQSLAHTLRLNLTPPPTFPGCSCAKKQSNQTKKAQGGPRGCPQPPPPTDPKVSAEQFVPSLSVLAHPAPPHPGTRRNKNFILPFPIPTPKTPRSGGEPPPPRLWQGPIGVAVRAFPPTPVPGPSSASPGSFPPPRRCRPSEGAELGCRGGAQKPALSELLRLL